MTQKKPRITKSYVDVRWNSFRHRRVIPFNDLTKRHKHTHSSINDSLETEKTYSHYFCFTVSIRTNDLMFIQKERQTSESEKLFKLILSLRKEGMGYRKISQNFNNTGITTVRRNS